MIRHAFATAALLALAACSSTDHGYRDRKGPTVVGVEPADGATGVSIQTEVKVSFSEAILVRKKLSGGRIEEFDFGGFTAVDADGKAVAGFITFNNDAIVFRPSEALKYDTKYTFGVNERIKDLFGNAAASYTWSFETEADRVPPTAPYNLIYTPLTNQATAKITGSMDANANLTLNGKTVVKNPDGGAFELSVKLVEGDNDFTFTAVDAAGNESDPVDITITRDSTPPAGFATCGAAGLQWHAGGRSGCWDPPALIAWNKPTLPIGATWTPGTDEAGYFTLGDQNAQPACTSAQCEYLDFRPALITGTVKLRAYTLDTAGNETLAFERDFRYDATPPALSITGVSPAVFPAGGLALAATTTSYTSGSFTIAKETGARYVATVDGAPAGACADAATSCTLAFGPLGEGAHRFAVTATDAAGNETRLTKFVTVDTTPPVVYMLPGTGSTPSATPTLHVFADEPVTTAALQVAGQSLAPVSDATSRGRHWTYTPAALAAASHTAVVAVYDAAGNRTDAAVTFSATGGYANPATTYGGFTTGGTGRDGVLTLQSLPSAPLRVAAYDDGRADGGYMLVATTGTSLTLALDPLNAVDGELRVYDDNGDLVAPSAALPADPWGLAPPAISIAVAEDRSPDFGPSFATVLPVAGGFAVFTDTGYAYWFDGPGGLAEGARLAFRSSSCAQGDDHVYPTLVPLGAGYALQGKVCDGAAANASVVGLASTQLDTAVSWPLWAPGASEFGTALTAAAFYGAGGPQVAVGAPGAGGKVYLYASTTATSEDYRLTGNPLLANGRFGDSVAFAAGFFGGADALAVVATGEPAVYFFDRGIYTGAATDPLGMYRVRAPLEAVNACVGSSVAGNGRHEVVNAGNFDGDADGSDDLIVASWGDDCVNDAGVPNFRMQLRVFLGGRGAAGANPQVVSIVYQKGILGSRPRLVPLGDLNGDGLPDLGFADTTGGAVARVIYGTASGTPDVRLLRPLTSAGGEAWVLAGAADADGDGLPDLILSRHAGYSQQVLTSWP